jgi:hypothetical protein
MFISCGGKGTSITFFWEEASWVCFFDWLLNTLDNDLNTLLLPLMLALAVFVSAGLRSEACLLSIVFVSEIVLFSTGLALISGGLACGGGFVSEIVLFSTGLALVSTTVFVSAGLILIFFLEFLRCRVTSGGLGGSVVVSMDGCGDGGCGELGCGELSFVGDLIN